MWKVWNCTVWTHVDENKKNPAELFKYSTYDIHFTFTAKNLLTLQRFSHKVMQEDFVRGCIFRISALQQHFRPECLSNLSLSRYTVFTVNSDSPGVQFRATADRKKVDLNVLWSLVHEKTVVLPHINAQTLQHTHVSAVNSHTLSYSQSCPMTRELVRFLWLPQMGLPDLRDDVIGFFKCLKHLCNLGSLLCRVL